MNETKDFLIKVRKRGTKAFWFLASNDGGMNRLRIHAVRIQTKERAEAAAAEITRDNPEYESKVVT